MRINVLVLIAALIYGLAGLSLTFAPAEILVALQAPTPSVSVWSMQLLGAALLGLAFLNYLQRYATVGGILGRPILLTNLLFLSVSFFASLNSWRHTGGIVYLAAALVFGPLFAAFGVRLFTRKATHDTSEEHRAA